MNIDFYLSDAGEWALGFSRDSGIDESGADAQFFTIGFALFKIIFSWHN